MSELILKDFCDSRHILAPINMSFFTGFYSLLGANGVGKSTFFKAIFKAHYQGSAHIYSSELSSLSAKERAKKIAYVSQHFTPYFAFSALEFISLASNKQSAIKAAERTSCAHLLNNPITQLSGGELALVRAAAAISSNAAVYLFDEPLAALDMRASAHLMAVLKELAKDACVIVSLHDPNAASGQILCIEKEQNQSLLKSLDSLNEQILSRLYSCKIAKAQAYFSYM